MEANTNNARAKATSQTALNNLLDKTDIHTKRMAGMMLLAALAPGTIAMVDDQETSMLGNVVSGLTSTTGLGLGGYIGHRANTVSPEMRDEFIRENIDVFKDESKKIGRSQGASEAVQYFADKKRELLNDISPIDIKRAKAFNSMARQFPEFGEMIADLNILDKTPRQVRGMTRGAGIGALLTAAPAYLALRNGQIEE